MMVKVVFSQDQFVGNQRYVVGDTAGFEAPVAEGLVAKGVASLAEGEVLTVAEDVEAPDGEVLLAAGTEIVAEGDGATVVSEPTPEAE